jgi:hypothetical protein
MRQCGQCQAVKPFNPTGLHHHFSVVVGLINAFCQVVWILHLKAKVTRRRPVVDVNHNTDLMDTSLANVAIRPQ